MSRNRNLAGLAALGALGYMMARDKKPGGKDIPVEDRGDMVRGVGMQDSAESEYVGTAAAPPMRTMATQVAAPRMEPPEKTVARVGADAMSKGRREMIRNPQRGPAFSDLEEMRAINAGRENITDLTREMSRGIRGRIPIVGTQNPQRGASFEEIRQKNEQDRIDALRASGGMRAKGGAIKMASGGSVNSASRRGDGIAQRGKTRGRMR